MNMKRLMQIVGFWFILGLATWIYGSAMACFRSGQRMKVMVRGVSRWWWSNRRWPRSSKVMVMKTSWLDMLFKEF